MRVPGRMLAIVAALCFLLTAFGLPTIGVVALLPFGLALLALHLLWPWTPWPRRT